MNKEQAVAFLKALAVPNPKVNGGWVNGSCPLAQWTHSKHADHTPSFGLSVNPGGRSHFNCFGCRSGSAEELIQALELYSEDNHQKYDFKLARTLLESELSIVPLPEYQEYNQPDQIFEEWPQYWLDSFVPAGATILSDEYLKYRKVDESTIVKFNLRFDSKRMMIVCPYYDVFGRFAGARGRSILQGVEGPKKHFDYTFNGRNNARLVWYNEQVLNQYGPAVVVEGQFDCWRTQQAYPKTLANLTAKPSWEKMKKLGDCPFLIHIPDDDDAGRESMTTYGEFCKKLGIGYKPLIIKSLTEEKLDPDKCHPDYLRDRIQELL